MILLKPIRLKFSGLQSYREEQEIDFENLGALGIFGVFGPTGGGKSTILDAVTLALFGRVERAKNGTRGIMNQYENKVFVSFEFALGSGRFLVERLFDRDKRDNDSVKSKNSRLVELAPDNRVLADKANDVDAKVSSILGMSFEDFSRAVVLPQGKFDQFLKLTGGERAKMLEHIFFLERYGESLSKKVIDLERTLAHNIETTQKLAAQLGDASQENISRLTEQLSQHRVTVTEKAEVRKKTELLLKELEQTGEIYSEITSTRNELEVLGAQKPAIERKKHQLDLALKAEPLRTLLEQLEDLTRREASAKAMLSAKEAEAAVVKLRTAKAGERLAKAKAGEGELNRLRDLLPGIAVAVNNHKTAAGLEVELAGANKEIVEKTKLLTEVTDEGTNKNKTLKEILLKIELQKKKHDELGKMLECRAELDNVLTRLNGLETAKSQEIEASTILELKKKLLSSEEVKLRKALSVNLTGTDFDSVNDDIFKLMERVKAIVCEVAEAKVTAEKLLDQVRVNNIAGFLAGKVSVGAPCPVCGSLEHPNIAANSAGDDLVAEAKDKADKAARKLDNLRKWESELQVLFSTVNNIQIDITEMYKPAWEAKKLAADNAAEIFRDAVRTLVGKAKTFVPADLANEAESIDNAAMALKKFKNKFDSSEAEFTAMTREISGLEEQEKLLIGKINELRARYIELNEGKINLDAKIAGFQKNLTDFSEKINTVTGGINPIEYQDSINHKISSLNSELDEAQKAWEKSQAEEREISETIAAARASWEKTGELLKMVSCQIEEGVLREGFPGVQEVKQSLLDAKNREAIRNNLETYNKRLDHLSKVLKELEEKVKERPFDVETLKKAKTDLVTAKTAHEEAVRLEGALQNQLSELEQKHKDWQTLQEESTRLTRRKELTSKLASLLKGRKFVQFLAEEHLADMTAEASLRLASLTGQRYALEIDENGSFVMRDDYSGGMRRPVNTLSGGETFLASLSMALALSSKIQLKGQYPLGFFFLDEGFGTLDPDKLEVVMNTLEKLHDGHRMVGVITHVQELRNRMPRYLEVSPAAQDGTGSRVVMRKN